MALSNELISQFVKATKDDAPKTTETTLYGTTVKYDGRMFVKIDGSELLTPVQTTASAKEDERVTVLIKNHTATLVGNVTSPSASSSDVEDIADEITEFEIVMAHKVSTDELEAINATIDNLNANTANIDELNAINADIQNLKAKYAEIEYIDAENIKALNADIDHLQARVAEIGSLSAEDLEAINADIENLRAYNADFTYVSADVLSAVKASIKELDVKKINADEAEIKYANIDFANIGEAAIKNFYAQSGIIEDVIFSEGHVTGTLVGVTIKGDLIEAGTLKADRLVIRGSDGNYYKLNTDFEAMPGVEPVEEDSIHGSIMVAKSLTAEKIAVDDLVAFDATIGGFNITNHSLYSGVKESALNTTRGVYLDSEGQASFGDSNNYLRYFKDADGTYKLEISASNISLRAKGENKDLETVVKESVSDIGVGARNLIRNSRSMIFTDYYFDSGDTLSVVKIEASYSGGSVPAGTSLTSLTGITVTATYSDGKTKTVTGYTLSGTIDEGANTITVIYEGERTTFTVPGVLTLTKITASYTGGSVIVGTDVDKLTGLTVTATYNNGTSRKVTGYSLSGTIKEGSNTITVTYEGETDTFTVTGVKLVTALDVAYTGGDVPTGTDLTSLTGLTVTATYHDGSSEVVTDYALSGTIKEGTNTITVTYAGKTDTFTVTGIKVLDHITASYNGGSVEVGTNVNDLTGIVVTAIYHDGSSETITDYTLSGTIVAGINTITVTYGNETTTFTVLSALSVNKITASYAGGSVPTGTPVTSLTDITVTATYSDNTTATVSGYTLSGTIKEGSNTITVTYEGKTDTFTVTGVKLLDRITASYDDTSFDIGTPISEVKSHITVNAIYHDGTSNKITDYDISGSISTVGNNTITISYNGKTTTVTVFGIKTLTKITASYTGGSVPTGTSVTSLTGITVTATYSDNSTAKITGYSLSGTIKEGSNTITVTYEGKTDTFTVTGVKNVTKISASYTGGSVPTGTALTSLTGITVTATYHDGSSKNVTGYSLSGTIKEGSNTITVTYSGKTDTFTVTGVKNVTKITASYTGGNVPTGTALTSLTGITVTATYHDGTSKTVTGYLLSGSIKEGSNTITVTYEGKTDTFTVTGVKNVTKITASYTGGSVPTGTSVTSLTGITVTATYHDGTSGTVTGYTLSGSISNVGSNTITVTYSGKTDTFTVTGIKNVTEITASYSGGNVDIGTPVSDLRGDITVTATYHDGTSETVTGYTLSGTIKEGSNTITVTYEGKTDTFTVTAKEPELVMKTGTIRAAGSVVIDTGLKSVKHFAVHRPPSTSGVGVINAVYNENDTTVYTYCNNYTSGRTIGAVSTGGLSISGGKITWTGYAFMDNVNYIWIAIGVE
jgi:uncharacterized protein YkuJ